MAHVHRSPLRVVHVHHGTGRFADLSEAVVRRDCERRGLALRVLRFAWDGAGNFEYQAAAFRRRILAEERAAGEWILLAHHRGDQVETLLQTLVRGAGSATPLGMAPERDHRLRPFLNQDRGLLLEHAAARGVAHVLDASNYDTDNFRNALRHQVLPLLRARHGRFEERLAGWFDDHRRLVEGLAAEGRRLFERHYRAGLLARAVFSTQPSCLWDFILKFFWETQDLEKPKRAQNERLKAWLAADRCGAFDHGGGRLYCDIDGLVLAPRTPAGPVEAQLGDAVDWGPWRFVLQAREPSAAAASYTLVPGPRPLGRPVRERLRLARVPLRFRQNIPTITWRQQGFPLTALPGELLLRPLVGPDLFALAGPVSGRDAPVNTVAIPTELR